MLAEELQQINKDPFCGCHMIQAVEIIISPLREIPVTVTAERLADLAKKHNLTIFYIEQPEDYYGKRTQSMYVTRYEGVWIAAYRKIEGAKE